MIGNYPSTKLRERVDAEKNERRKDEKGFKDQECLRRMPEKERERARERMRKARGGMFFHKMLFILYTL